MVHRSSTEVVADYFRETEYLNQSALKVLIQEGPEQFLTKLRDMLNQEEDYGEKDHFIIGSGVDTKLTFGEEVFKERYHYSTLPNKPKGALLAITKMAFAGVLSQYPLGSVHEDPRMYKHEIFMAMNTVETEPGKVGWYMNLAKDTSDNDTTRMRKFFENDPTDYWKDLIKAGDKQILDEVQHSRIVATANSFKTHKFTKWLFEDTPGVDKLFQFPLFGRYNDVRMKGLPDLIMVNHAVKKIYVIDFKTMFGSVLNFNRSVRARRYDFQGSYYNELVSQNLSELSTTIDLDVTEYEVSNFAFAVESSTNPGFPIIFVMNEDLMGIGRVGDGRFTKGWVQAVNEYKAWDAYNFDIERRLATQNGILHLDMNFDYLIN